MLKLQIAHKNFIKALTDSGKSPATLTAYNKDIEQLVDHLLKEGVDSVDKIELSHLEKFMKNLSDKDYTNKSVSRKTNATRTFMKHLFDLGHIKENVGIRLRHPKVEIKAPRILTKVEYRALRDSAKDDTRSYAMIEVLLQTGITISELAKMKVEHLEIHEGKESGSLTIPRLYSKDTRTVPLNKAVIETISKYIEEERPKIEGATHVFITKTGKPLLIRNIRSTINRFYKAAGIENATVNDLRHTFIAHHLIRGVNLVHLSKIVGHKRVSTTERYLEYIQREVEEERTELGIL